MNVLVGRIYRHYKGNYYLVESIATHSESGEQMVVYKALYGDGKIWVRPYESFVQELESKNQKHRFELQEIEDIVKR